MWRIASLALLAALALPVHADLIFGDVTCDNFSGRCVPLDTVDAAGETTGHVLTVQADGSVDAAAAAVSASAFVDLTDSPSTITADECVQGNGAGDALVFGVCGAGGGASATRIVSAMAWTAIADITATATGWRDCDVLSFAFHDSSETGASEIGNWDSVFLAAELDLDGSIALATPYNVEYVKITETVGSDALTFDWAGSTSPTPATGDSMDLWCLNTGVGATGPAGTAGAAGTDGTDGAAGAAGAAGSDGAQGPQGTAGAAGPAGAQGVAGPAGGQGPAGAAGATGPAGPAGADGMDGSGATTFVALTDTPGDDYGQRVRTRQHRGRCARVCSMRDRGRGRALRGHQRRHARRRRHRGRPARRCRWRRGHDAACRRRGDSGEARDQFGARRPDRGQRGRFFGDHRERGRHERAVRQRRNRGEDCRQCGGARAARGELGPASRRSRRTPSGTPRWRTRRWA